VAWLGLQPIVATLILMVAGRGLAQLLTDGQIVTVYYAPYFFLGGGYLWIKSRQPAVEDAALSEEEQRALEAIDSGDLDTLSPHNSLTKAGNTAAIKH